MSADITRIDREIYKKQLLIDSCEAKLNRVEPLGDEYNSTVTLIDETHAQILKLQRLRLMAEMKQFRPLDDPTES